MRITLERYEIEQTPGRITITLNQKRNAVVNMAFGMGVIALAIWLLSTSRDPSSFYYVMLVIGILWSIGATAGYRKQETFILSKDLIEWRSSGRSGPAILSTSDLLHVLLRKIVRPTGRRRHSTVPFRWRVILIDKKEKEFKRPFRLQEEEHALELASIVAAFYGLEIRMEER